MRKTGSRIVFWNFNNFRSPVQRQVPGECAKMLGNTQLLPGTLSFYHGTEADVITKLYSAVSLLRLSEINIL